MRGQAARDARGKGLLRHFDRFRQPRRSDQADAHRLAVAHLIVTQQLERMSKSVAEVEHGAPSFLVGVFLHHLHLDADRLGDGPGAIARASLL